MTSIATEMQNLLVAARLIGVAVAKELTPTSDELTARKAYAIYGKPWIEEQRQRGLLTTRRKGKARNSPVLFSKLEIEALLEAERSMVRRAKEHIAKHK